MRAILFSGYGAVADVISFADAHPRPVPAAGQLLVKVHACSLAPGDWRVLSGRTARFQGPPSMPYIPGGDAAGEVVDTSAAPGSPFAVGQRVWVRFEGPRDALAEYMAVPVERCNECPDNVNFEEATVLGSSALAAMVLVNKAKVRRGDRVLVLGGSGGVGAHVIQLLKRAGASFVATTSTQSELCTRLGADRVVDYRSEDVWALGLEFDLVLDCWGGREPWVRCRQMRPRPRAYMSIVGDASSYDANSAWDLIKWLVPLWWRGLWTSYSFVMALSEKPADAAALTALVQSGDLKLVLDERGPDRKSVV